MSHRFGPQIAQGKEVARKGDPGGITGLTRKLGRSKSQDGGNGRRGEGVVQEVQLTLKTR